MTCKKTQQCGTPCNLKINGYKLFNIVDDGMYVSKSKEDLLNSFVTTKENNFEDFKKEFTYKDFAEKILNIVEKNKNE